MDLTTSEVGGLTGLWNLDFVLQDGGGSPLPSTAQITITMEDTTNATTVASATYNVDDVIGVDSPISESNWIALVEPHMTANALSDGSTVGFALHDFLVQEDDLSANLSRTFTFSITVSNASLPSPTASDTVNYSFEEIQYTTEKSGTHQQTWGTTLTDYGLIDWGDGTIDEVYFQVGGTISSHSYPDSTEKTVKVYIPTAVKTRSIVFTGQSLTSFSDFDTSAIISILLRFNANLTSLPDWDFTSGTLQTLNLEYGGFTTINSAWDISSVNNLQMNNCNLTSLPSAWDVSNASRLWFHGNDLTSLPSNWNTSSCTDLRLQNNLITTLPATSGSQWDVSSVTVLYLNGNNLTSLPSSWNVNLVEDLDLRENASLSTVPSSWLTAQPIYLRINDCSFSSIPLFDFNRCQTFTSENNSITSVPSSLDLSSLVNIRILADPLATWDQTSIATSVVQLHFINNNLPESEVDDVLAQLRTSYDLVNRVIDVRLDSNVPPSATGEADRDYLIANGCTVITD